MLRRILYSLRRFFARFLADLGTEVRRISRPAPVQDAIKAARTSELRRDVASGRIAYLPARKAGCSREAA